MAPLKKELLLKMILQDIFNLETDLFPCLGRYAPPRCSGRYSPKPDQLKKAMANKRTKLIATNKNRNRNRHSDMGTTDRFATSF